MKKLGKITAVAKGPSYVDSKNNTLAASLKRAGYTRMPGTAIILSPHKEKDGSYRTGLDEDALYIRNMSSEAEREQEKAYVKGLYELAKRMFGDTDIGPRSAFYTKSAENFGEEDFCQFASLKEGDNKFDLTSAQHLIKYAYLRVHPSVAPSSLAVQLPKYNHCLFYVNDYDNEHELQYKTKAVIAKAIADMTSASPTRKKRVARLCGFHVEEDTKEEVVFNILYDFIQESTTRNGNVQNFNKFFELSDENLNIRNIVEEAITLNVIRKYKSAFFRGDNKIADTKDDIAVLLTNPENSDLRASIEEEIKLKKTLNS